MTKQEFARAFKLAETRANAGVEFDHAGLDLFWGCGLPDFKPVACTVEAVADLIRWQARCLDCTWNQHELNSLADIARRKFTLLN